MTTSSGNVDIMTTDQTAEIMRTLGRVEAKIDSMHERAKRGEDEHSILRRQVVALEKKMYAFSVFAGAFGAVAIGFLKDKLGI